MPPTFRQSLAGPILLLAVAGCDPQPPAPPVHRFETNDYTIEYDGEQKKTTIGSGLMRMARYPEDIVVSGGTLRVGPRDYGAVAIKDAISVVGGKVAVNGRGRKPASP